MSFVRLLLDYTTLDHQRNYDIKKSLKVTNVKEGIQRCEGNSKNCFEETETETETETERARLSQLSFLYGLKGEADVEEKNDDGKNKILRRKGFKL